MQTSVGHQDQIVAGMKEMINGFPDQLEEALQIVEKFDVTSPSRPIANILICGMGGSGIGGDFVKSMVGDQINVPVLVNKGYNLPSWVGTDTLVIISSYSGNTQETLAVLEQARGVGAQLAAVSSGGKLAEIAKQVPFDIVEVPGGFPPRTCLGYSFVSQLGILQSRGVINDNWKADIKSAAGWLKRESSQIRAKAAGIAGLLKDRISVFYGPDTLESILRRACHQLNENSKAQCWFGVLPEMNHNGLVAWSGNRDDLAVLLFRDANEIEPMRERIQFTREVIRECTPHFIEVKPSGSNRCERLLYYVHLVDWISYELAIRKGVDPLDIRVLDRLKQILSGK